MFFDCLVSESNSDNDSDFMVDDTEIQKMEKMERKFYRKYVNEDDIDQSNQWSFVCNLFFCVSFFVRFSPFSYIYICNDFFFCFFYFFFAKDVKCIIYEKKIYKNSMKQTEIADISTKY